MVRPIGAVLPVLTLGLLAASRAAADDEPRTTLGITRRRVPRAATVDASEPA